MLRWWGLSGLVKCALIVERMRLVGVRVEGRLVRVMRRRWGFVVDVWRTQNARVKCMATRRALCLGSTMIENKGRTRLNGIRGHGWRSWRPVALVRGRIVNFDLQLWVVFVCNERLGSITSSRTATKEIAIRGLCASPLTKNDILPLEQTHSTLKVWPSRGRMGEERPAVSEGTRKIGEKNRGRLTREMGCPTGSEKSLNLSLVAFGQRLIDLDEAQRSTTARGGSIVWGKFDKPFDLACYERRAAGSLDPLGWTWRR